MSDIQAINLDEEEYERVPRELPKDIELNLSVFRCDYKWSSWHGFWENIKWFFRSWRPAWHRATRGYCRMDTWNADVTICIYLIKVLTEYRNVTNGYPGNEEFPTFEKWIAAIDQCIDWLIFSVEDPDKLNKRYVEYQKFSLKGPKNWTDEEHILFDEYVLEANEVYKKQCETRKKAFAFLGEYLPHIWW